MLKLSCGSFGFAPQGQQVMERQAELPLRVSTKVLLDQMRSKTIKTGGHCSVSGEEIPARVMANATSKGCPVALMKLRARSNTAKAACPSFK